MTPFFRHILSRLVIPLLVVGFGCVEPYAPPALGGEPDIVVIDAFMDASASSCRVQLSKAVSLSSETTFVPLEDEFGNPITVHLEDDQGGNFQLVNTDKGLYELASIPVDDTRKYRIKVSVPSSGDFVSDFVSVVRTPGIDDVFFDLNEESMRILVNTEATTGEARFFRWEFEETFEYTSNFASGFRIVNGEAIQRTAEEQIYRCYKTTESSNILVASSAQLTEDVIRNFHIQTIPRNSQKLQILYSILVRQYGLTEAAYNYWLELYRTNENLGGLFDPMPGEVTGNFTRVADPAAPVIGFFSAGTVEEKRIFIGPNDLPVDFRTFRLPLCSYDTVLLENIPQTDGSKVLISTVYSAEGLPRLIGYTRSEPFCVDCQRVHGGATVKPPFWP